MRRAILFRSVARFLDEGTELQEAAFMWTRHRWMVPYAIIAALAVFLTSEWAGFTELSTRVALAFAAGAIAVNATTDYRVLARTTRGLLLLKASRIRQYATGLIEWLPASTQIEVVGGTVLATDWQVGEAVYTVPKSSEQAIQRIAQS
ncbi:MAG: hypothetical protein WEA76_09715 [Acidimicrobiia bacterium]